MSRKKRVLIFSEYWSGRGSGGKYLLSCIETLLFANYDVTIIAQTASFNRDAVARCFQVNIDEAKIVFVEGDLNALRQTAERISGEFDFCLYMTNYRFFNSHARQTYTILPVSYGRISVLTLLAKVLTGKVQGVAEDFLRSRLLGKLRETQAVIVWSKCVHDSLEQIHGVPSTILEPAIDDFLIEGTPKERVILSVGRFYRGLHNRHEILIEAFKQLYNRLPNTTWQYLLAGTSDDDEESKRYLEELLESAKGFPIYFHVSIPQEELKRHYNTATLYWDAAGCGVDEKRLPERAEHFGISTLETMSAKCVPVVINSGGQKEIVSHDESGYLCNSMDEMVEHSLQLIADKSLLAMMQTAARERFRNFDREHFSKKLLSILEP